MPLSAPPVAGILDNVNGLPSHALIVHFTVVIASAGAIGGLLYALIPRIRRWASWPLLFVGLASILLGFITPSSGESLERRTEPSALLEKHTELGDQMGTILIAYGILLALTVLVVRWRRRGTVADDLADAHESPTVVDRIGGLHGTPPRAFAGQPVAAALLTVLVLAGSVVSGIWIYRTGEAGARSVYHDTPQTAPAAAPKDGDEG